MPIYQSGNYERKGGDNRLRQRYQQLERIAAQDGILDQARKSTIPQQVGAAFSRLTEFFRREEFAVAGALDVLIGNGEEGETVGGRFVTEMLQGTKLGNAFGVGGARREEGFNEVFEQAGIGEGGQLSDITGDWYKSTWVGKYFDPTARGTAALASSIFFTPSTYLTAGFGGAAKWVGRAGEIRASGKALQLGEAIYKRNIVKQAQKLGLTDEISKSIDAAGKVHNDALERKVIKQLSTRDEVAGLGDFAESAVINRLRNQAESQVADIARRQIKQFGKSKLAERSAIRFGSNQFLGGSFKGIPVVSLESAGPVGKALAESLRGNRVTRPLIDGADKVVDTLDGIFNRVPRKVRGIHQVERMESFRKLQKNASLDVSEQNLDKFFPKSLRAKFGKKKNRAAAKALIRHLDNPTKHGLEGVLAEAKKIGVTPDEIEGIISGWRNFSDSMGRGAVALNLIDPEQFALYRGNYFPHVLKLEDDALQALYKKRFSGQFNPDMGRYARQRVAPDMDALENAVTRQGLDPNEVINWNPFDAMLNYARTHVESVADVNFVEDVTALLGHDTGKVFRELSRQMDRVQLTTKLGTEATERLSDTLSRASEGAEALGKEDVGWLMRQNADVRAHFLYEATARARSVEQLDGVFVKLSRVIDSVNPQEFAKIRRKMNNREIMFKGRDVGEYTFTRGAMKGQTRMMPKAVAEFFEEEGLHFTKGLNPAQERVLKAFDLTQNTFKITHTGLFPAFHVRNAISNTAAIAAEVGLLTALNPARLWRTAKTILKSGDDWSITASNGAKYSSQQIRKLADQLNILPQRMRIAELTGDESELLSRIPLVKHADRLAGRTGQQIENTARMFMFQTMLERGVHPLDAARRVQKVLFDYDDLSKFEKDWMRRLFPFYTWTRKNAELQIRNMLTRPGAIGMQVKAANAGDRSPQADLLPEFMRGEMKVGLKNNTFITGIDLPINNVNILWNGSIGKTMREQFNMFSPVLKAPLEYTLNLDTFSGQPIKGRKWIGRMGPTIDKSWPDWAKEWIELEKVNFSGGGTGYKANGTAMWLLTKNIFMGRMVNEAISGIGAAKEFGDGNTEKGAQALMKTLTGMRFTEMDLTQAQQAELRRKVREIEDYLLQKGSVAEFKRTFRPESRQR